MRHFNLSAQTEWQLPLRYNIAPTQDIAVIVADGAGARTGNDALGADPLVEQRPIIRSRSISMRKVKRSRRNLRLERL